MHVNIDLLIPEITDIIPYKYDNIKCNLYDKIINDVISKKVSNDNKFIFHMLGIPVSGKTTFIKSIKDTNLNDCILIGFDDIMEKIPYYLEDNIKFGSV